MNEQPIPEKDKEILSTPGFAWRVGLSTLVVFAWLAFVIVWLFFYAEDYNVWQNIAAFMVSILIGIGILAATWASWGIKYASRFEDKGAECGKPKKAQILNTIAGFLWLIFLIVWLYFYAGDYNGYQNLAIFITSLLVLGAVTGSAWMVRWIRASGK
ncbi:MAG: hypothetical protein JSV94_05380 [Methanobacteriota archaeon]|nr:MAG: hypothetical protein JSV94_05380 [Euryarchaeota archaeon]